MPGFTEGAARRIADAVKRIEHTPNGGGADRRGRKVRGPNNQVVKVTSLTTTAGLYPAVLRSYDGATNTYADMSGGTCWYVELNGKTPTLNAQYSTRQIGTRSADGLAIFACESCCGGTTNNSCTEDEYCIVICNSNAVTDDAFDISINGHALSTINFNTDTCQSILYRTNAAIPISLDLAESTDCCVTTNAVSTFSKAFLTIPGTNTLRFALNTSNGSGDYGFVQVSSVWLDPSTATYKVCKVHFGDFYSDVGGFPLDLKFTL